VENSWLRNELSAERKNENSSSSLWIFHGYSRSLSNQGRVLIQGHRCSVIGSVNMNMMTIDITDINTVKNEDEVVLIGSQKT
jgi:alanine racemase